MIDLEPLEPAWLDAFIATFERCAIRADEVVVVLCEQHTRLSHIRLSELALDRLGCNYHRLVLPSARVESGPIVRSTGASTALNGKDGVVKALCESNVIIDLTVEGLMHAPQTGTILQSGARIMNISNEHPDALCRLLPDASLKDTVRTAVKAIRNAETMQVSSPSGTDLTVSLVGASTVGVWGWTDRPGTLAHWPGGLVVSFPVEKSVNGALVLSPGDINLTFKRYIESPIRLVLENDFVAAIEGDGADAELMKHYLSGFNDPLAYATSHVGWGLNPAARYEALTMYDKNDTNGTELRALSGNFLYSTGANEFAKRFTRGHFDLPMMGCTISLDGTVVVQDGVPQ